MSEDAPPTSAPHAGGLAWGSVRASTVLRVRKVWLIPLLFPLIMVALVTTIYIGSVMDPLDHLHGLPVRVVDQDAGATTPSGHTQLGQSVVQALRDSGGVTHRLGLEVTTLTQAQTDMNHGKAYLTLVIPPTFTASALQEAGLPAASGTPAKAAVQLLENSRMGTLGVNLGAGVLTTAIDQISTELGTKLTAQSTAAVTGNPLLADVASHPITLSTNTYRPLPNKSALGLSAFYVSLVSILGAFVGATLINSSMDGALGYATTDIGPKWKMRMPLPITRRQTLITKLSIGAVLAPVVTALVLLISIAGFGMYAPNFVYLWLLLTLAAWMVMAGALALLVTFGSMGQLLAMIIILYLSLSSSGGTVPIQALPGFFRVVGDVEPLRQLLGGARGLLYFDDSWHAGVSHAVLVLGIELAFWLALGLSSTTFYDRRKLYRMPPELMQYVRKVVAERTTEVAARTEGALR